MVAVKIEHDTSSTRTMVRRNTQRLATNRTRDRGAELNGRRDPPGCGRKVSRQLTPRRRHFFGGSTRRRSNDSTESECHESAQDQGDCGPMGSRMNTTFRTLTLNHGTTPLTMSNQDPIRPIFPHDHQRRPSTQSICFKD